MWVGLGLCYRAARSIALPAFVGDMDYVTW